MKSLRSGLVTAMTAGALLILPMSNSRVTRVVSRAAGNTASTDPKALYTPQEKEYWFSADEFDFIRPGVNVAVNSIKNVGPGMKPVIDVSITDDLGQPLDRNGVITPGAVGMEFILARYKSATRDYFNYTAISFGPGAPPTPLHDVGGTWQDIDLGHSVYTFGLPMPANFDVTQTATLGVYSNRQLTAIIGKDYQAPAVVQYFRPDGGTPSTDQFNALDISACNTCHNPLSMHGQFGPPIQDVKLCVMCHTPDFPTTQTGESLNFKVFIHKLHDGANLPSVQAGTPYVISPGNDFSTVVFPQDIRNCQTCHSPAAAGSTSYFTYPNRAACGSCHDDVNFVTGANHPAGPQADDSLCASCHQPQGAEYDASVMGAHTIEYKSTQLHGLVMQILSVTGSSPGQNPVIKFQVKDKNGTSIDPRQFDTLQFTMNGPTTDYAAPPISEDAQATTIWDGTNATYTMQTPIPAAASGTWVMTCDVEWTTIIHRADGQPDITGFTETPLNPIYYMAVTDAQAVPRRTVVDLARCNVCHDHLALHGGRRVNTEGCIICHNPVNDDSSRRPADQNPPESISFQRMIHRIHTGENLTHDYTIYGFGGSTHTFNGVLFPGDRRDCQKCHTTDANGVGTEQVSETPPAGLLPTTTLRDWYSPMQHYAAACLGCHDSQAAAAHAFTQTANFPNGMAAEACATCHGPDAAFSVDKVHAR